MVLFLVVFFVVVVVATVTVEIMVVIDNPLLYGTETEKEQHKYTH